MLPTRRAPAYAEACRAICGANLGGFEFADFNEKSAPGTDDLLGDDAGPFFYHPGLSLVGDASVVLGELELRCHRNVGLVPDNGECAFSEVTEHAVAML